MAILKIKRLKNALGQQAPLPQYQTTGAAGMDLAAFVAETVVILPGQRAKVPTGIAIELESAAYAAFLMGRSSMGTKHGVCPANGVGLIDSDYRGEICVILQNNGQEPFTIQNGDRIAQLVIVPVVQAQVVEAQELTETARGANGFGSTGKR